MLFNSYVFVFAFLPAVLSGYFFLNHCRLLLAGKAWLLGASLFFYSWWNISFLPLILASILINYAVANQVMACGNQGKSIVSKKALFIFGILFNVGLLSYFKYANFFITNVKFIIGTDLELLHIALPLAISFFTLQQIAFQIDVYEGLAKEHNFIDYALFVSFFPQLIAGPIVHHKEMMPQFQQLRSKILNYKNLALGLFTFSIGFFKKAVIADTLSAWVITGFDNSDILTFIDAWVASLSFVFQVYFDFSGYADMAIGIALMFNIKIPINFNSPYKATNIIHFWQCWHITLTHFINTYIYTPLMKSMGNITFSKAMWVTLFTMSIVGLWHGASWTFVFFGLLHGMALIINHCWRKYKLKMPTTLAWILTFNFINMTFVIFRAREWADVFKIYKGMAGMSGLRLPSFLETNLEILKQYGVEFGGRFYDKESITTILFLLLVVLFTNNTERLQKGLKPNFMYATYAATLLIAGALNLGNTTEFIYFNF